MTAITCFKPPGVALTRSGAQLAGGLVFTYSPGTTTAKSTYPTYADALAGTNANANPVQLDTQGNAQIWLSGSYKLVVGTNAGTPSVPVLGVTIETYDSYPGTDPTVASGNPPNFIDGLQVALDTGDAAHDVYVGVGEARDGADGYDMVLAAALVKQVDAPWAVGTNAGGLDTGSVSDSTVYYIWLIARSDTGVVDALISLSGTAPTMPASYDKKRLVGVGKYGIAAWSQMSAINRPWQEFGGLWPDTGVAGGYIITPYPVITRYAGGLRFSFVAGFSNAGASTLNVNGLGTKAIQRSAVALTGGEIAAGATITVEYDAAAGAFQIQSGWQAYGLENYCGTSGGTDTVTASASPAITAYIVGQKFHFKAGGTNTGATTLNINGVGAGAVQKRGAALVAGDITAGNIVDVEVSATTPVFQMVSPVPGVTTIAALTDVAAQTVSQVPNADNAIDLGSSGPKGWRKLYMGDGTVSLPAVTFSGDTDNGLYRIGTNNWALAVAGAKALELDPSGTILRPLQSAFLALAGAASNVTGDGTTYTMTWTTEILDQNADFASSTYTAAVGTAVPTLFTAGVYWTGVGALHTAGVITLATSNRSYQLCNISPTAIKNAGSNADPGHYAQIADMDSGDTATITTQVSNSTKTIGVDNSTYFAGYML